MSKTGGYEGRVSHQGAQAIKAPFGKGSQSKGGKVVKGGDLRSGKK